MTKEEIEELQMLDEKFQRECSLLAVKLRAYNEDFYEVDRPWTIEDGTVMSEGDVYRMGCHVDHVCVDFPAELLTYNEEQVKEFIDYKLREKENEAARMKEEEEERKRQSELAELKRLREKYNV